MTLDFLQQHWAVLIAGGIATAVLLFAGWRARLDSPRGRLRTARRRLREREVTVQRQRRRLEQLSARLQRLQSKAESVKPVRLQEAAEAVQDGEALLKIANDQLLIAENHVRKIIVEEFPPKDHQRMRSRYLSGEPTDGKPFSF